MKKWIPGIALSILPIIFLPLTQDFYDTNKWMWLVLGATIILFLTGISFFRNGTKHISISYGTLAFGALSLPAITSLVAASTNKIEALLHPLGLVTFLALMILVTATTSKTILTRGLYLSATILNLIAIYQFFSMGSIMFPRLAYLSDALWTPSGATTSTIAVSVITLILLIPDITRAIKKSSDHTPLALLILALLVIVAGTSLTIWQFIPKLAGDFLPISVAWPVMLEVFKNGKTAVFGVGVENFVSAYTIGKPISILTTPLWNIRFAASNNFFFHLATVYGSIGLIASLLFAYILLRATKNPAVIILLLFPPTLTVLTVAAILFSLSGAVHQKYITSPPIRYAAGIFLLFFSVGMFYGSVRFYAGELYFFQALAAAEKNQGTSTYNFLGHAIQTNTYMSRYHIAFGQVNLSLANSLATKATEADRSLMSQLVQQGISEAKAAVTISPQNINAWENLGSSYQAVIPIATGSDAWAETAYQKALSIDPTNPALLVNLGGVLVHEKKYDDAVQIFLQAIQLKSDYANAYYNLANVYTLQGNREKARAELIKTMNLVTESSSDYVKVKNELYGLTQATVSGQTQLTLPQ